MHSTGISIQDQVVQFCDHKLTDNIRPTLHELKVVAHHGGLRLRRRDMPCSSKRLFSKGIRGLATFLARSFPNLDPKQLDLPPPPPPPPYTTSEAFFKTNGFDVSISCSSFEGGVSLEELPPLDMEDEEEFDAQVDEELRLSRMHHQHLMPSMCSWDQPGVSCVSYEAAAAAAGVPELEDGEKGGGVVPVVLPPLSSLIVEYPSESVKATSIVSPPASIPSSPTFANTQLVDTSPDSASVASPSLKVSTPTPPTPSSPLKRKHIPIPTSEPSTDSSDRVIKRKKASPQSVTVVEHEECVPKMTDAAYQESLTIIQGDLDSQQQVFKVVLGSSAEVIAPAAESANY
ncbi:hypothetical protein HDV05_001176 [Chytridiales sp. JEL 0842]|nr:hypothetical protein HDV05_001176 [Chytridiales sp. JEL 0842]